MSGVVLNLYAGPGTGKSTTAAGVFASLKAMNVSAELAHEYAKDLTWEDRHRALAYAPYVHAKQAWHVERVREQVDVVVTDSPILMGLVYKGDGWTDGLAEHIVETHDAWSTLDVFLQRNPAVHPYRGASRSQSEDEAVALDGAISDMLVSLGVRHHRIRVQPGLETARAVTNLAMAKLRREPLDVAQIAGFHAGRR